MKIGTPKEIKNHEYRVGLTPAGVAELTAHGHQVFIEQHAGAAVGYTDGLYQQAGAVIVEDANSLYQAADLIVKIKEPQHEEYPLLEQRHTLFTYLHLAPDAPLVDCLVKTGLTCIAYETVEDDHGRLPLLAPMSEVAGKLATQVGAHYLETAQGGDGILLGGVEGVDPAEVLIFGGGVVGSSAAEIAIGMGAHVRVVDRNASVLNTLHERFKNRVVTVNSTDTDIAKFVATADLIVGAVLVPGGAAPMVLSEEDIKTMRRGSVIVDVAIDQGGCFATSRPTSHADPVYRVHGVTHYCVTNIPSAAANTATRALTRKTLPYIISLADEGIANALNNDAGLMKGLNVYRGDITYKEVAIAHNLPFKQIVKL